jgi:NADH-quinone oxidoreductase subunit N
LGAFSSGLLLFGCSLVYGFSGTTNFEDVFRLFFNVENSDVPFNGLFMGVLFILLAFMFKIAASPFHVWITDIYEGSPTFVTAYFSVVPKIAIFGLTLKLTVFVFENFQSNWQVLTVFCGIASLFVGCFGALYQRKVKRLLAYSAVGHTGYLLIGLSSNSIQGVEAVFFYIIVYVFMGTAVFCIILNNRNTRSLGRFIFLTEFLSFSKLNPVLAFIFTVILFSMAGIPPLAGFLSKMNIFLASVGAGFYTTTGIALVLSGLGAVYYIRIIKIMYFEDSGVLNCYSIMAKASSYILIVSFSFLVLLIAYPNMLNVFVGFACTGFFL